jgi:hypothetical protein
VAGFYEHGNEPSCFIKVGNVLTDCYLLKKVCALHGVSYKSDTLFFLSLVRQGIAE